jgi:O-antigen ligase
MFAIPGIVLLIITVYIRPHELFQELAGIPFLYIGFGLTIFGIILDWRLRRARPQASPQLGWAFLFMGWCVAGVAIRAPAQLVGSVIFLGTSLVLYLFVGHGLQSFRRLEAVAAVVLAISIFLSFVGAHQGFAPFGCHVDKGEEDIVYDGRPCANWHECEEGDAEPGVDYTCEHVGLFGTSSIGFGRVRWIGHLHDPNELAMTVAVGLPFAFAFFERKRSMARFLLVVISLALAVTCIVFTQSRGGQLVFLAVMAVYFVRRFGIKGIALGAIVALPILMLGGREGREAEASSRERLNCWYEGMTMAREHPLLGVGQGQFVEHHTQTAHNSYVLSVAELGFTGMVLWTIMLWLALKVPVQVLRQFGGHPDAAIARTWAMALLAAMGGLIVGIFFLSWCYHPVLWIYFGLIAALYSAVKAHDPHWDVRFGWADLGAVLAIDSFLVVLLYVYTRIKGAP